MSELSGEGRALFRKARAELTPSPRDVDRIERAIGASIALVATSATVASTASATASGAAGSGVVSASGATAASAAAASSTGAVAAAALPMKWLGVVAVAVGVGVGGAGYRVLRAPEPAVDAVVATAPAVSAAPPTATAELAPIAPASTVSSVAETAEPSDTAKPVEPERHPPVRRAVSSSSVADEARILEDAEKALARGDADGALRLLDQHQRAHPGGVMSQERAAERVFALCAAGRTRDAEAAAASYLQKYPASPLAKSVAAGCPRPKSR
ncbi:MAG: hypothetical protein JNK04_04380 [Myxococcales bacterium]|nr:hypothetical protein [Myxococcales bacterium]